MKYKQKKLLLSGFIFLVGMWISVYFTTILHYLLESKIDTIKLIQFRECISSMAESKQHLILFLCFVGVSLLFALMMLLTNTKPYKSDMEVITPQISIPKEVGQKQFGSARFLTDKEIDKNFDSYNLNNITDTGGIVLGMNNDKIYYNSDDTHSLIIGATRSGKSRCIVLQSIVTLAKAEESIVLNDPKGELHSYTSRYLEEQGYKVICLDFKNPLKSEQYNFLQPIIDFVDKNDIPKAIEITWDLTQSLVPEDSHNEKIWTHGEASILASAIMSVVYDNRKGSDRKYQNMTNVYYFISEMCKSHKTGMPIVKYMKTLDDTHPAKGLLAISEVAPSKTRSSFYTSALTTLRLFTNPLIYSMSNNSSFKLEDVSRKKIALFIILPDERKTYYALASLFINQLYASLVNVADGRGGRLEKRVNLVLDEFGNFTKLSDFDAKLTVGGGRGIRFNLFLQSLTQLDNVYGKEVANTVKGNCEYWVYLQAEDIETLEEINKKLGNYTTSTYQISASHQKFSTPSSSHSTSLTHRALLTIEEIRRINRPYQLVLSRNDPAMMYAPDISKTKFNKILGLGDKNHNRKLREKVENTRIIKNNSTDIKLWGIWEFFSSPNDNNFGGINGTY